MEDPIATTAAVPTTNGNHAGEAKETTAKESPAAETASSASKSHEESTVAAKAAGYLAHGRRHLLVRDIPSAVAALAEACRILGEEFGETADQCAEAYYYYGTALLEMARHDGDVLGDAVDGEKAEDDDEDDDDGDEGSGDEGDDDDDEEDEDESADKDEADAKTEKSEEIAQEKKEELTEEKKESTEEKKEPSEQNEETEKPATNGKGKSLKTSATATAEEADAAKDMTLNDTAAAAEEAEDVSTDLQLAWEVLELSKQIYERQAETQSEAKPRLADVLLRLAEVAIESENYTSAIEDLLKCIHIQKSCLRDDSRSLAETHYQLGVAYTFTTDFNEAVKSFEAAAAIIKMRIDNLNDPVRRKTSVEDPKPHQFYTVEGEIEELQSLLPDIREKIADTIDLEKEAARKVRENGAASTSGFGEAGQASTSSGFPSAKSGGADTEAGGSSTAAAAPKPALDITHLIRKKRKPEEDAEPEEPAKKVCPEPQQN